MMWQLLQRSGLVLKCQSPAPPAPPATPTIPAMMRMAMRRRLRLPGAGSGMGAPVLSPSCPDGGEPALTSGLFAPSALLTGRLNVDDVGLQGGLFALPGSSGRLNVDDSRLRFGLFALTGSSGRLNVDDSRLRFGLFALTGSSEECRRDDQGGEDEADAQRGESHHSREVAHPERRWVRPPLIQPPLALQALVLHRMIVPELLL